MAGILTQQDFNVGATMLVCQRVGMTQRGTTGSERCGWDVVNVSPDVCMLTMRMSIPWRVAPCSITNDDDNDDVPDIHDDVDRDHNDVGCVVSSPTSHPSDVLHLAQEYHVLFHPVWRVPVFYFNVYDSKTG